MHAIKPTVYYSPAKVGNGLHMVRIEEKHSFGYSIQTYYPEEVRHMFVSHGLSGRIVISLTFLEAIHIIL